MANADGRKVIKIFSQEAAGNVSALINQKAMNAMISRGFFSLN